MRMVRYKLDSADPPRLTAVEKAALDSRSHAKVTAAAEADPDNPPLAAEELERLAIAGRVKRVRRALGLTQEAFAARFGIPVATLRQWEMGRRTPDRASLSYLRVIAAMPDQVAEALGAVRGRPSVLPMI